jgi:hypothetical protein
LAFRTPDLIPLTPTIPFWWFFMIEFLKILGTEAAKAFAGEAAKAGARALFSERTQAERVPQPEAISPPEQASDPVFDAQAVGEWFLSALAQQDHDAAWALCDPEWPYDPERSQSYHATFGAAPPISWAVRQIHVPGDWTPGNTPAWAGVEVLVTFDLQNGTYSAIEGVLWIFPIANEWRVADVYWAPAPESTEVEQKEFAADLSEIFGLDWDAQVMELSIREPEKRVILCTRCPQKLSVPVGVGRIRVKCPACWTQQVIDS